MKLKTFLLFFASLFCACQIVQNAQPNEFSNEANSNRSNTEIPIENKQSEKIQPKPVDDSRFSSVKINRTNSNKKFSLKIDVQYPQLKKPKTPPETKFNQYVKSKVDEQIADFNSFLVNEKLKEVNVKSKLEFEINLDYKIEYISESFTSVLMNWNGYSGYLNMDYFPSTINFDLKKGKPVELEELFETQTQFLEKISELSLKKLRRTCLSCPCKDGTTAGKSLPEGVDNENRPGGMFDLNEAVAAKEENFANWSITTEGLKITFNEYQVGPGCIGIIDIVIPFEDLQPILRKDLNFK